MNIFLTGATGFLGGEVLVDLSKRSEIDKIFCLVRAKSAKEGKERLKKIFSFHDDAFDSARIIPIVEDLIDVDLAPKLLQNHQLDDVDVIIHSAANTSFSRIYDDLIEKTNIQGLKSILEWSSTLQHLKTFVYVGTATICGEGVSNRVIKEEESPNLDSQHFVKYTYTKMMGEMMLRDYLPEDKILVVRPSIVMGDSRTWKPRSYVIMWTLATMNMLRLIPVNKNAKLDVIPVDYCSKAIIALLFAKRKYNVYHISSGQDSATTALQSTNTIEPFFNHRPKFKFIDHDLINQLKLWAKDKLNPSSEVFNSPEYLAYWEKIMGEKNRLRIIFAGLEPYLEFIELSQVFDNSRLLEDTDIGPSSPAHEYIVNSIPYLDKIDVFAGAIDP